MTTRTKHELAVEFVYSNLVHSFADHARVPSKRKCLAKDWYIENVIIERLGEDVLNEMQRWNGEVWQEAWERFDKKFNLA